MSSLDYKHTETITPAAREPMTAFQLQPALTCFTLALTLASFILAMPARAGFQ